jgi:hypothetical protein
VGNDRKPADDDFDELVRAGFPVGKGAPAGADKTADWSDLSNTPIGSGVPDGLTSTADWTGIDDAFPVGTGLPDGIDKTADWTGIELESATRPVVPGSPDTAANRGKLRGDSFHDAIAQARARKGLDKKLDFDSMPSIQGIPVHAGAPQGSDKTQDWTLPNNQVTDAFPTWAGVPQGSDKTQDWTSIDEPAFPTGSGVPDNVHKTTDWTAMDLETVPAKSGAPPGTKTSTDWTDMSDVADDGVPRGTGAPDKNSTTTQDWSFDFDD